MSFASPNFTSRTQATETIKKDLKKVSDLLRECKSYSMRHEVNKKKFELLSSASNTLKGVIRGIDDKSIAKQEAMDLTASAYQKINRFFMHEYKVESANTQNKLSQSDAEKELFHSPEELKEKARLAKQQNQSDKIANHILDLRDFKMKLPTKVKGYYTVAKMPVVPMFKNPIISNNIEVLRDAGFKPYSYSGKQLEGYAILADQAILIVDFEAYAADNRAEKEDEFSELMEAYRSELKAWKEDKESHEARKQQLISDYNDEYDEWLSRREAYQTYAERLKKKPSLAKFKAPEDPGAPPKTLDQAVLDKEFDMPKPKQPKIEPLDIEDSYDIATKIVEELSARTNEDYVLMSQHYVLNPRALNGKHICFWIIEKWKVSRLSKSYQNVNVNSWSFPF